MSCMYVYATFDHQLLRTIGRAFCVREIVKLQKKHEVTKPLKLEYVSAVLDLYHIYPYVDIPVRFLWKRQTI